MLTLRTKAKEGTGNTFGLPRGEPIRKAMAAVFREQRNAVLKYIDAPPRGKKSFAPPVAPALPTGMPDWDHFELGALKLAERMTPLLTMVWDTAASKFATRVGLDPNEWSVVNPHTQRMIQESALAFCESTNAATSGQLDTTLHMLRVALIEGVVEEGEALRELAKRVGAIFDKLETSKARQIAATETSRAVHSAQEQAAFASCVVTGWKWRASADACREICLAIAARAPAVRLGEPFATIGTNPHYSRVKFPPGHPDCNCTVEEVLDTDPQPAWHPALKDPGPATDAEIDTLAQQHHEAMNGIFPPAKSLQLTRRGRKSSPQRHALHYEPRLP